MLRVQPVRPVVQHLLKNVCTPGEATRGCEDGGRGPGESACTRMARGMHSLSHIMHAATCGCMQMCLLLTSLLLLLHVLQRRTVPGS